MDVFAKARELGIDVDVIDGRGREARVAPEALSAIVAAMPRAEAGRLMRAPAVLRAGDAATIALTSAATPPVRWSIVTEQEQVAAAGAAPARILSWPGQLAVGHYRLRLLDANAVSEEWPLIVAPATAYGGDFQPTWLLTVQLYGLRSPRNWGIGDFSDLARVIELAAWWGADGVGLNPLHALFPERPDDCSPYAPNSRLFLNPLYIDVEAVPELPASFAADHREALRRVRGSALVDYAAIAELKWRALRAAFARFSAMPDPARARAFDEFRDAGGATLRRFGCFEVLRRSFRRPWWEWPAPWRDGGEAACGDLRSSEDRDEIVFAAFVQWIAEQQLRACRDRARRSGLRVGLYLDVAVGVSPDGFDAWNEQQAIARHLAVGAPPDALNTAGQDWGLAGFNPAGLEARRFAPFRDMLRAAMRHAGAIRLDHAFGLKRLYLVPQGFGPRDGAYVRMPFQALLAIIAQESVAARCVVIGEDLGTVPEGFRDETAAWGVWSYRVMMFERDAHGFHGSDRYAADALVTFSTHDLASFAGWRDATDLTLKQSLGIDPGESREARRDALRMLSDVLHGEAIAREDFLGVLQFLSNTRARLLAVALDDLLAVAEQPNVPGTVDQHPNWRRRLPIMLDEIAEAVDERALRDALGSRASPIRGGARS
ncbi:MAG: 4-alpha-glucanotransferase [Xanthobacteraceae bacterium]|nr:4-alpha-glucanotransferase [Xanthobacteraceae bacterium]